MCQMIHFFYFKKKFLADLIRLMYYNGRRWHDVEESGGLKC